MISRGLSFLAVIWFGSSLTLIPSPVSSFSVSPDELTDGRAGLGVEPNHATAKTYSLNEYYILFFPHFLRFLLIGKTLTDTFPPYTQALASAFWPGQPLLTDSLSKLVWLIRTGCGGGMPPLKGTVSRCFWPWKNSKWRWGDNQGPKIWWFMKKSKISWHIPFEADRKHGED